VTLSQWRTGGSPEQNEVELKDPLIALKAQSRKSNEGGTDMKNRNRIIRLFVLLLAAILLLSSCSAGAQESAKKKNASPTAAVTAAGAAETPTPMPGPTATPGPLEAAQELADYLFEHGELPENFVTKKMAMEMGWQTIYLNPGDIEPGLTIGGDYFGNYERRLPYVKGRKYYEADCFYQGGKRNEYRIIYSSDGHVWYTEDHYNTFTELFPSQEKSEGSE